MFRVTVPSSGDSKDDSWVFITAVEKDNQVYSF